MTTKTVTYSEARNTLADCLREVVDDMVPIVIKQRGKKKNAVLVSEDEYNSLMETAYLLDNPVNAERLASARKHAREKKTSGFSTDDLRELCK
ncbi:MAG: type II toxin-antitoxin system prevent-host-death family antitoxin [Akkermansia sp.]